MVRLRPARLRPSDRQAIERTIPNRMQHLNREFLTYCCRDGSCE